MIRLHHAPRTRSVRVVWLCEEMGVPYEIVPETLAQLSDELTTQNPARTLPMMIDGEHVFFESVTMMEYIADTYGPTPLALSPDHPAYWDYRQMLMFGEATLAGPVITLMASGFLAPPEERDNWGARFIRSTYKRRLAAVSQRLAKGPYMAGDEFTLADISVAYSFSLGMKVPQFGLIDAYGDDHKAYYARVSERPAFQRMIKVK